MQRGCSLEDLLCLPQSPLTHVVLSRVAASRLTACRYTLAEISEELHLLYKQQIAIPKISKTGQNKPPYWFITMISSASGGYRQAGQYDQPVILNPKSQLSRNSPLQQALQSFAKENDAIMPRDKAMALGRMARAILSNRVVQVREGAAASCASRGVHSTAVTQQQAAAAAPDTIEVSVNDQSLHIPKGSTVLQACEAAGIDIPR